MEDKHLDKIIREKLGRLDVPYQPDTWDALAKRMDAEATETQAEAAQEFDEGIRQRLHAFEPNFQQGHWNTLAKQLEAAAIRKQLYRYKATELLLLLLVFFTMAQLLPEDAALLNQPVPVIAVVDQENASDKEGNFNTDSYIESKVSDKIHIDTNASEKTQENTAIEIESSTKLETETPSSDNVPPIAMLEEEEREDEIGFEPIKIFERENEKTITPLNTPIQLLAKPTIAASLPYISSVESTMIAERTNAESLVQLDGKRIALLEEITQEFVPPVILPKSKYVFRVGFASTMSLDYFKTPIDSAIMLEHGDENLALGYGGGLSIGWKHERVEIESGLNYASKSYAPTMNLILHGEFESGYVLENIERINFSSFELPIQIKYDVISKPRWTLYPMMGTSLHIVREYITEVKRTDAPIINGTIQNSPPSGGDLPNLQNTQLQKLRNEGTLTSGANSPILSDRTFTGGWNVKENNFGQNSYVSLNAGVGVEFKASETCSFFAQSVFKYNPSSIVGVGTNRDRIHTTTLTLGIKAKL